MITDFAVVKKYKMNINSTFQASVFLMAVLVFSIPFVTLAQQNAEVSDAKSIAARKTKSENQLLIATAKVVAERDAKVDFGNNQKILWFSTGFGCSVLGVAAAYLWEAQPLPTRLLGKSPEYVEIYGYTYQSELQKKRVMFAGSGCVVSLVLLASVISNDSSDINTVSHTRIPSDNTPDVPVEDACSGCLSLLDLLDFLSSCFLSDSSCFLNDPSCASCSLW